MGVGNPKTTTQTLMMGFSRMGKGSTKLGNQLWGIKVGREDSVNRDIEHSLISQEKSKRLFE